MSVQVAEIAEPRRSAADRQVLWGFTWRALIVAVLFTVLAS